MIAYDDPDYNVDPAVAAAEILGYAVAMGEERKGCPMDDIATKLVTADLDGESLSSEQFAFFDPNPHVGFGDGGAHYCIGASLAKLEIDLMFNAIADHLPDITALGPPRRLRSAWLNGIKGLPVRYA